MANLLAFREAHAVGLGASGFNAAHSRAAVPKGREHQRLEVIVFRLFDRCNKDVSANKKPVAKK